MMRLNSLFFVLTLSIILQLEWSLGEDTSHLLVNGGYVHQIHKPNVTFNVTEVHDELYKTSNNERINVSESDQPATRIERAFNPGTRWCGIHTMPKFGYQLGFFYRTDMCCRAHEFCPRERFKWAQQSKLPETFPEDDMTSTTAKVTEPTTTTTTREPVSPPRLSQRLNSTDSTTESPFQRYQSQEIPPELDFRDFEMWSRNHTGMGYGALDELQFSPEGSEPFRPPRWVNRMSACQCDRAFYFCLRYLNNIVSRYVGKMYFNVLNRRCVTYDHPATRCLTRQGIFGWRCIEYEVDTTQPMNFYTRDNPYFHFIF